MEIKKYTKKPIVIEAVQLKEPNIPEDISRWCNGKVCGVGQIDEKVWIEIYTLEGIMKASYGDFIIKGIQGEFYPCKPDIFHKKYEPVATSPATGKTLETPINGEENI